MLAAPKGLSRAWQFPQPAQCRRPWAMPLRPDLKAVTARAHFVAGSVACRLSVLFRRGIIVASKAGARFFCHPLRRPPPPTTPWTVPTTRHPRRELPSAQRPHDRPLVPYIVSIDVPHAYTKEPSMNLSRPDVFNVRFSPLERRLLEAIAGLEGQKLSEALRWLIREEARRRGLLTLISQEWQSGERAAE